MTLHAQSVRAYLSQLETRGWLKSIPGAVDPRFEVSAHLCRAGNGPALRFERVTGSDMKVFGNLLSGRERIALGLNAEMKSLQSKLVDAIRRPAEPVIIKKAPCQETVVERPDLVPCRSRPSSSTRPGRTLPPARSWPATRNRGAATCPSRA